MLCCESAFCKCGTYLILYKKETPATVPQYNYYGFLLLLPAQNNQVQGYHQVQHFLIKKESIQEYFSNVVFPIPFVPTSAIFCPRSIEKFNGLDNGSSYPVTRSFVSKSILPGVLPYLKWNSGLVFLPQARSHPSYPASSVWTLPYFL